MTNRYSERVLAEGEAYEDSPERAQNRLAEALAVLRMTSDALTVLWREVSQSGNAAASDFGWPEAREKTWAALAEADALLARGGK